MNRFSLCALAVVGAAGLLAAASPAQALSLQEIIDNGTPIVAGDKIFSNFTYLSTTLPANQIAVNFVDSSAVQFGANWNSAYGGGTMSSVIGYTVSVSPGADNVITGAGLDFAGHVIIGDARATVGETIYDDANGKNYGLQVYFDGEGGLADNLSDSTSVDPGVTSLRVIKSIDVSANGQAFGALNFVANTFTQTPGGGETPPVIPEPASLALLPLAIVGLALRKRLAR